MKHMIFYEADGGSGGGTAAGAPPAQPPATPPAGGGTPPAQPPANPPANPPAQNVMDILDGGGTPPAQSPATPPAGAPEKYVFNLGEGLTISEEQQTALTEIARNANMNQETLDALLKMHSDIMLDTIRQAENQRNEWAKQCHEQGLADKVHIGYAKKCIETFGGGEAMQALVDTGAANHPAVQRMLQRIGELITEDNGGGGDGKPPAQQIKDADLIFPNSQYPKF